MSSHRSGLERRRPEFHLETISGLSRVKAALAGSSRVQLKSIRAIGGPPVGTTAERMFSKLGGEPRLTDSWGAEARLVTVYCDAAPLVYLG